MNNIIQQIVDEMYDTVSKYSGECKIEPIIYPFQSTE